jgi:hypothetical protein
MLMACEKNFRESWWHNRDYRVFVANPLGREAMKQGAKSSIEITKGQSLQFRFGALIHKGRKLKYSGECKTFLESEQGDVTLFDQVNCNEHHVMGNQDSCQVTPS